MKNRLAEGHAMASMPARRTLLAPTRLSITPEATPFVSLAAAAGDRPKRRPCVRIATFHAHNENYFFPDAMA
jgi:hypothetical protein